MHDELYEEAISKFKPFIDFCAVTGGFPPPSLFSIGGTLPEDAELRFYYLTLNRIDHDHAIVFQGQLFRSVFESTNHEDYSFIGYLLFDYRSGMDRNDPVVKELGLSPENFLIRIWSDVEQSDVLPIAREADKQWIM